MLISLSQVRKYFPNLSPNTEAEQFNSTQGLCERIFVKKELGEKLFDDLVSAVEDDFSTRPELKVLYDENIDGYLSATFMREYVPFLGIEATQWQLEQFQQNNFVATSAKSKSLLIEKYNEVRSSFLSDIQKLISKQTFDGVRYSQDCTATQVLKQQSNSAIIGLNSRF